MQGVLDIYFITLKEDLSLCGCVDSTENLDKRRLTGAIFSDYPEDFSPVYLDVYIVENSNPLEFL